MAALRVLARLFPALLAMMPAALAAQVGPRAPLAVEAGPQGVLATLTCPVPDPDLLVAVDHTPVRPAFAGPPAPAPPAVALVVEVSAAMEAAGTPHSSRLRDAVGRAEALLAMAPPGSAVSLVTFDRVARLALPLTPDRRAARAALLALLAEPQARRAGAGPNALAEAVGLGLSQLRAAPAGPRALAAFVAASAAVSTTGLPDTTGVRLVTVAHGGEGSAGDEPAGLARSARVIGAAYVPYHSPRISGLPTLNRSVERHFAALLAPGARLQLRLAPDVVGPGPHLLTVEGCGDPIAAAFEGPGALPVGALGVGAAAALAGVALAVARRQPWRPRRGAAPTGPAETTTARLRRAAATTTARRAAPSASALRLRAVLWDERRRVVFPLEGRHWTIGSDSGCDLCLPGEGLAPLHARLSLAGDQLRLTDLESPGGTLLGGRPLAPGVPAALALGETAVLGPAVRLMVEGDDEVGP